MSYIIIAAIDYSELGNAALDETIRLGAGHEDCEIHAIHVDSRMNAPTEPTQIGSSPLAHSDAALDHLEEVCHARLEKYRRECCERGVKRLSTHFRFGKPAKEIVQLAVDFGADLVVIGTHGRKGLTRLVLGSVAEQVVRDAPCQVLVVRKKKMDRPAEQRDQIEPLCVDCQKVRAESQGEIVWCKRHSEPRHINTHRYTYGYANTGGGGAQSTRLGASR